MGESSDINPLNSQELLAAVALVVPTGAGGSATVLQDSSGQNWLLQVFAADKYHLSIKDWTQTSKELLLTMSIQESEHISCGHTSTEQPGSDQALPLLLSDNLHYLQLLHVGIQLVFQVVWNRTAQVTESRKGRTLNCAEALQHRLGQFKQWLGGHSRKAMAHA